MGSLTLYPHRVSISHRADPVAGARFVSRVKYEGSADPAPQRPCAESPGHARRCTGFDTAPPAARNPHARSSCTPADQPSSRTGPAIMLQLSPSSRTPAGADPRTLTGPDVTAREVRGGGVEMTPNSGGLVSSDSWRSVALCDHEGVPRDGRQVEGATRRSSLCCAGAGWCWKRSARTSRALWPHPVPRRSLRRRSRPEPPQGATMSRWPPRSTFSASSC